MKFCVNVLALAATFLSAYAAVDVQEIVGNAPKPQLHHALDQPLKVRLERVAARNGNSATFYVGKLAIGQPPQELKVLFDTSSGHVLVPHKACKSLACREHKQYSPWASTYAIDVNVNGSLVDKGHRFARHGLVRDGISVDFTQADLGEGEAKAVVVRDDVCMEGDKRDACVNIEVV